MTWAWEHESTHPFIFSNTGCAGHCVRWWKDNREQGKCIPAGWEDGQIKMELQSSWVSAAAEGCWAPSWQGGVWESFPDEVISKPREGFTGEVAEEDEHSRWREQHVRGPRGDCELGTFWN